MRWKLRTLTTCRLWQDPWIPAFAGMTEEGLRVYAVRTIIPAFAGMTATTPAIGVSGAPSCAIGDRPWIPAFAGMTGEWHPVYYLSFPPSRE